MNFGVFFLCSISYTVNPQSGIKIRVFISAKWNIYEYGTLLIQRWGFYHVEKSRTVYRIRSIVLKKYSISIIQYKSSITDHLFDVSTIRHTETHFGGRKYTKKHSRHLINRTDCSCEFRFGPISRTNFLYGESHYLTFQWAINSL